jgi:hypothetical protein
MSPPPPPAPAPGPPPPLQVNYVNDFARAGQSRNRPIGAVTTAAAAILLGVACTVWSTIPQVHKASATLLLVLTVVFVAGSALRLSVAWIPLPEDTFLMSAPLRALLSFLMFLRVPPWEEGAAITIVWLEVLHPSRPWHTAALGAALTAYLITVHLAESGSSPRMLRSQIPVLAAGACLLALGAGAAMLPVITSGSGSALLRIVAAVAVIIAAGLVLPHVTTRPGR